MLGEPDPTMSHSLRGLPGRLFSMQITDVGGHAALRRRAPLLAVRRSLGGGAGKAARVSAGTATGMFLDDPAGDVVETPAAAGACSPGSKVDACVGPETAPSRQSRMARLFPQTIQSLRRRHRGSRPHAPSRIFSLLTSFNPLNGCCMRHRKPSPYERRKKCRTHATEDVLARAGYDCSADRAAVVRRCWNHLPATERLADASSPRQRSCRSVPTTWRMSPRERSISLNDRQVDAPALPQTSTVAKDPRLECRGADRPGPVLCRTCDGSRWAHRDNAKGSDTERCTACDFNHACSLTTPTP